MGSLSNLYISQSYISLLHLGSDTTASSTPTEIEDGLGNGIGITVNNQGDLLIGGTFAIKRGLDVTGSVTFNTAVTASTQQFVNSGNQFTDNIIRITGSYSTGSVANPGVYQIQNGWKCFGPGLGNDGAVVIANDYVPATGWRFTIDKNTAVWFGLYNFTDPNKQYINFAVSGSEDITGSLWVRDNITTNNLSASGNISASNLWVKDTIHAYKLDVTIESSSIIFTSGSNILGDEANVDTQTLIGRVIVSGSLEVTGSTRINGNTTITGSTTISGSTTNIISNTIINGNTTITGSTIISGSTTITGSITASGNISSSTLSGVGNLTLYSQSVDSRIIVVSASAWGAFQSASAYSASAYTTITNLSSSIYQTDATQSYQITANALTASNATTIVSASAWGAFQSASAYSASAFLVDATQSVNITQASASAWGAFQSASAYSASAKLIYATTGSNNFVGNQTITGSLILSSSANIELTVIGNSTFSGSVRGIAQTLTISSQTASMDLSTGNFFLLTLVSGSNTYLNPTNINPGETISLLVQQPSVSYGTLTYPSTLKFPTGFAYVASTTSSYVDIITFVSFNTASLYSVAINNFS